ncbi:hypothetical protein MTO96_014165 [Rhipicephalus appendiculatus]
MNCWNLGQHPDACTKPNSAICHYCGQAAKAIKPSTYSAMYAKESTQRDRACTSTGSIRPARHSRPSLSPSLPHQHHPLGPS